MPPSLNQMIAHHRPGADPVRPVYEPERIPPPDRYAVTPYAAERIRSQMPQHRRRTVVSELENVQRVAFAVGNAAGALLNVYAEIQRAGWFGRR